MTAIITALIITDIILSVWWGWRKWFPQYCLLCWQFCLYDVLMWTKYFPTLNSAATSILLQSSDLKDALFETEWENVLSVYSRVGSVPPPPTHPCLKHFCLQASTEMFHWGDQMEPLKIFGWHTKTKSQIWIPGILLYCSRAENYVNMRVRGIA